MLLVESDINVMNVGAQFVNSVFPTEWAKAALVLALFSTGLVIGLFFYLSRYTRKSYFNLWTCAWMFYAIWLVISIQLDEAPDLPVIVMVRRACIGISALCMFWGSFQLTRSARTLRELGFGVGLVIVWSYVAAYKVGQQLWITVPVFALLAMASIYTALPYWRTCRRWRGSTVLAFGFTTWGVFLMGAPFEGQLPQRVSSAGYFATALVTLVIAIGMVIQILEQARDRNETLVDQFKKGIERRRQLEQKVTNTDQMYRALFESANDAIFLVDLETLEVLEVNQSAERLTQRGEADLTARSFADFCPAVSRGGETPLENKEIFDQLFQPSNEFGIVRINGSTVACEGRASVVRINDRPVLQINVREITERKAIEQQLRQAEKLSALGQLIAGVAHELNNPLAVIMGYAQLLAKEPEQPEKTVDGLQKILHESERASKIVRNLLTFARPREPQMAVVQINNVVKNVVETHQYDFRSAGMEVTCHLSPDIPYTKADPNQVEQVLTNLVSNATQAMLGQAGLRRLELTTEVVDNAIRITIGDTGPGIPGHILGKIFDPFFTTKAPGKGTGLGLSLSYSIVEEHRGKIWVQSEVGAGTRFYVELPIVPCEAPKPATGAARRALDPQASSRRLLVVDDEPGIVEVLRDVLGSSGYSVETATDGRAALELLDARRYDLVITDLCMPRMDGEHLYKVVREKDPDLASRIIFVTGDTVSTNSRAFLEWTGNRWLTKPFNIGEVEELVGNFLRGTKPTPAAPAAFAMN